MSILLNIGSILLGLLAWAMPVTVMAYRKNPALFAAASFFLCSLSLLLQIGNILRLCRIRDFAAIDDTIGAVTLAAVALVAVSVILNALALLINKIRK